jgi:hypothetical protein
MFYRPKAQIEQATKQTDASSAANCTITRALYIAKSKYWHKMTFILRGEMKVDRSSRKKCSLHIGSCNYRKKKYFNHTPACTTQQQNAKKGTG